MFMLPYRKILSWWKALLIFSFWDDCFINSVHKDWTFGTMNSYLQLLNFSIWRMIKSITCTLGAIEGRNRATKYVWNFFKESVAPLDLWQDRWSKSRVFTEVWGRRMCFWLHASALWRRTGEGLPTVLKVTVLKITTAMRQGHSQGHFIGGIYK